MRKCIRCGSDMKEGCTIKVEGSASRISVISDKNKLFGAGLGRPNCAICPNCGEISLYITDVDKLK